MSRTWISVPIRMRDDGSYQQLTRTDLAQLRRSAAARRWPYFMVPRAHPDRAGVLLYRKATRAQVLSQRMHLNYRAAAELAPGFGTARRQLELVAREWHEAETVAGGLPHLALDWFMAVTR